jgi:hypothetical protein
MARGARPGERRGGRAKGTPNKMTVEKMRLAMLAVADTGTTRAVDVLGRVTSEAYAMCQKYGPTGSEYNDDLYRKYLRLTAETASRLAPYQTPQLTTLRVSGDSKSPLVVREGVTSQEIMAELMDLIAETGILPSPIGEGGGVIDGTLQGIENRSD